MANDAKHLRLIPLTLTQANALIADKHRHHKRVQGHRFTIGATAAGELVGVAVTGRPVARNTPQYSVAEVTRLVADGTPHVCSMLYSACARAAAAMGYDEIQTFILESESGTSLKAAGWEKDNDRTSTGGSWNRPSRGGRRDDQPQEAKQRWFKMLTKRRVGSIQDIAKGGESWLTTRGT